MEPFKENLLVKNLPFPVDVFISDNSTENIDVPLHWHDCFEILYILEGRAIQYINDKTFPVAAEDIIILYPGDVHATKCNDKDTTKILALKFLSQVIDMSCNNVIESKYVLTFLNVRSNRVLHMDSSSSNLTKLHSLMLGMYEEFIEKDLVYEIVLKGQIFQLVAYLLRGGMLSSFFSSTTSERDLRNIAPLLKYIENNYKEEINLKNASNLLNTSYYYASRYFKKVTGRNFKEYVDFIRICEAEKLLLSKDINVTQAAYEVGFSNVSAFCRVFRRIKNYSPGKLTKAKAEFR